jgi:hypothetical protein
MSTGEPWHLIAAAVGVTWPMVTRQASFRANRARFTAVQIMHKCAMVKWIAGKAAACAFDVETVKTVSKDGPKGVETTTTTEIVHDAAMARVALEATDPERFGRAAGAGHGPAVQVNLDISSLLGGVESRRPDLESARVIDVTPETPETPPHE